MSRRGTINAMPRWAAARAEVAVVAFVGDELPRAGHQLSRRLPRAQRKYLHRINSGTLVANRLLRCIFVGTVEAVETGALGRAVGNLNPWGRARRFHRRIDPSSPNCNDRDTHRVQLREWEPT